MLLKSCAQPSNLYPATAGATGATADAPAKTYWASPICVVPSIPKNLTTYNTCSLSAILSLFLSSNHLAVYIASFVTVAAICGSHPPNTAYSLSGFSGTGVAIPLTCSVYSA